MRKTQKQILAECRPFARQLGWSVNKFRNNSAAAILELINSPPEKRLLPRIVRMADAMGKPSEELAPCPAAEFQEWMKQRVASRAQEKARVAAGRGKFKRHKSKWIQSV